MRYSYCIYYKCIGVVCEIFFFFSVCECDAPNPGCPLTTRLFVLENDYFLIHGLGKCEGVGEDSRHGDGT